MQKSRSIGSKACVWMWLIKVYKCRRSAIYNLALTSIVDTARLQTWKSRKKLPKQTKRNKILKITCWRSSASSSHSSIGCDASSGPKAQYTLSSRPNPAPAHSLWAVYPIDWHVPKNGVNTCPPVSEWNIFHSEIIFQLQLFSSNGCLKSASCRCSVNGSSIRNPDS